MQLPPPLPPSVTPPPPSSPPLRAGFLDIRSKPESKRLTWPLIAGLCLLGPFVALLSILNVILDGTASENTAHRAGAMVGAAVGGTIVWPLIVVGLFSIGRRFRNIRSQTVIVLCAWALFAMSQLALIAGHGVKSITARVADQANDDKVLTEMQAKAAELKRKLAEVDDLNEQMRLQAEVRALLEGTLPKLSPKGRAGMLVTIKIVNPIMDDGQALSQASADFFGSPAARHATAQSPEDLTARMEKVDRIIAMARDSGHRLDSFEADAKRLLDGEKLGRSMKTGILTGLSRSFGKKAPQLRKMRAVQEESFDNYRKTLVLLRDNWGKWHGRDDGVIEWEDEAGLAAFNAFQDRINALSAEENEARRAILVGE